LYSAFGSKDELYAEALQYYNKTYDAFVWGTFREARTAREAAMTYLFNSAAALTSALVDTPRGCMVTLATVGSEGHEKLGELMRMGRSGAYTRLITRFEKAVIDGELPTSVDVSKLARFLQTVQSGMSIRARDGANRVELEGVAELAMLGWDGFVAAG
jgi:AcrR family transcriptional regulator